MTARSYVISSKEIAKFIYALEQSTAPDAAQLVKDIRENLKEADELGGEAAEANARNEWASSSNDELQIDPFPAIVAGEEGTNQIWVNAWVLVENGDQT